MKKFIITIILLILLMLTGCSFAEKTNVSTNRFEIVGMESSFAITVDRETNVMYAVSMGAYNTGTVTLLVDTEGEPLIWKGDFKD